MLYGKRRHEWQRLNAFVPLRLRLEEFFDIAHAWRAGGSPPHTPFFAHESQRIERSSS
ncbi:MAG: hypothetical protein IIT71_03450 [Acetobacter sp.]|nr:hypothetical protein [Acetobacter sp.]